MGDGSRNRLSRHSTLVAPVVYMHTLNASTLEGAVGCGEKVRFGAELHLPLEPTAALLLRAWWTASPMNPRRFNSADPRWAGPTRTVAC